MQTIATLADVKSSKDLGMEPRHLLAGNANRQYPFKQHFVHGRYEGIDDVWHCCTADRESFTED